MARAKRGPDFRLNKREPDFPLSPVTLLVLLAAPTPAGIVAADLVALGDGAGRGRDRAATGEEGSRGRRRTVAVAVAGGGADRLGAGQRLVLVGEPASVEGLRLLGLLELGGVLRLELRVEEMQHDLLTDRTAHLAEHRLALARVLDERVLLGHGAQVHALAQVVHVLEVLAPAGVDDLQDD